MRTRQQIAASRSGRSTTILRTGRGAHSLRQLLANAVIKRLFADLGARPSRPVTYVTGSVPLFEVAFNCLEIGHSRHHGASTPKAPARPGLSLSHIGLRLPLSRCWLAL